MLLGALFAIFDAWSASDDGIPPDSEMSGGADCWQVVIVSKRNRILAKSDQLYAWSDVEARRATFRDLVAMYTPEELQQVMASGQ